MIYKYILGEFAIPVTQNILYVATHTYTNMHTNNIYMHVHSYVVICTCNTNSQNVFYLLWAFFYEWSLWTDVLHSLLPILTYLSPDNYAHISII